MKRKFMDSGEVTLKFEVVIKLLIILFVVSKQFIDLLCITQDRLEVAYCVLCDVLYDEVCAISWPQRTKNVVNIQPS